MARSAVGLVVLAGLGVLLLARRSSPRPALPAPSGLPPGPLEALAATLAPRPSPAPTPPAQSSPVPTPPAPSPVPTPPAPSPVPTPAWWVAKDSDWRLSIGSGPLPANAFVLAQDLPTYADAAWQAMQY